MTDTLPKYTIGDDQEIECPWCGENLGPIESEDLSDMDSDDECQHCRKPVTLSFDWSVTVTANARDGE
jgi:hypothetical protein